MKKYILITIAMSLMMQTQAQRSLSLSLYDNNGKPLQKKDVSNITLTVLSPDHLNVVHKEIFTSPDIIDGLTNLVMGFGSAGNDYSTDVNNYFESLPLGELPPSGVNFIVKVNVELNNGSKIETSDYLYANTPEPLIKGEGGQFSYLSNDKFILKDNKQTSVISPGSMKLAGLGLSYTMDLGNGLKMSHEINQTNLWALPDQLSIDDHALRVWKIWKEGFEFKPDPDKYLNLDKNGMNFVNPLNDYKLSIGFNKFNLGQNNYGWELTPSGGYFKTTKDKSINFNNNMIDVVDSLSKRGSRLVPNGLNNMFENKSIMSLGVTSLGNPQVVFNRSNGVISYSSGINDDGGMDQSFYNKNGNVTFRSTTLSGTNGDNPYIYITKDGGAPGAGMFYSNQGVATLFATVKNFRMDHPDSKDQDIVYASLEGPEAAAYCRGTSRLENGKSFIRFPDHFKYVCDPAHSTIQLTPKSAESEGLAVVAVTAEGFQIVELHKGRGDYEFYWEAKSTRKGFENYQVIRPKADLTPTELNTGSWLKN